MERWKWDWYDTWLAVATFAAVSLIAAAGVFISADRTVRGYYMRSDRQFVGFCVYTDINWMDDPVAFCSDDIKKVTKTLERLRAGKP